MAGLDEPEPKRQALEARALPGGGAVERSSSMASTASPLRLPQGWQRCGPASVRRSKAAALRKGRSSRRPPPPLLWTPGRRSNLQLRVLRSRGRPSTANCWLSKKRPVSSVSSGANDSTVRTA